MQQHQVVVFEMNNFSSLIRQLYGSIAPNKDSFSIAASTDFFVSFRHGL